MNSDFSPNAIAYISSVLKLRDFLTFCFVCVCVFFLKWNLCNTLSATAALLLNSPHLNLPCCVQLCAAVCSANKVCFFYSILSNCFPDTFFLYICLLCITPITNTLEYNLTTSEQQSYVEVSKFSSSIDIVIVRTTNGNNH